MGKSTDSVRFNYRLKFQILKTIMIRLTWIERFFFVFRFVIQRYKIRKSELFTSSEFAKSQKDRLKLQLDVISTYAALRMTIGDEKALAIIISVLQASASEAFVETMQLISKLSSMKW